MEAIVEPNAARRKGADQFVDLVGGDGFKMTHRPSGAPPDVGIFIDSIEDQGDDERVARALLAPLLQRVSGTART